MKTIKELESSVSLSQRAREIILGALLGDGSLKIHEPYKNARFSFRHSGKQSEYFYWKANELKEISSGSSVFIQKADGYSNNEKIRFQSGALESLTELYKITHKKRQLFIRRRWLNMMSALSLAIWWMDDGSLISNGRKGVICTDGLDYRSLMLLKKYLWAEWGLNVHIGKIGKKRDGRKDFYYRLWLRSTEELKKFLRVILPYIKVESMLSKVVLLYKDVKLQQRWISEVSKLSGFSTQAVEKAAQDKKSKWKAFRE